MRLLWRPRGHAWRVTTRHALACASARPVTALRGASPAGPTAPIRAAPPHSLLSAGASAVARPRPYFSGGRGSTRPTRSQRAPPPPGPPPQRLSRHDLTAGGPPLPSRHVASRAVIRVVAGRGHAARAAARRRSASPAAGGTAPACGYPPSPGPPRPAPGGRGVDGILVCTSRCGPNGHAAGASVPAPPAGKRGGGGRRSPRRAGTGAAARARRHLRDCRAPCPAPPTAGLSPARAIPPPSVRGARGARAAPAEAASPGTCAATASCVDCRLAATLPQAVRWTLCVDWMYAPPPPAGRVARQPMTSARRLFGVSWRQHESIIVSLRWNPHQTPNSDGLR